MAYGISWSCYWRNEENFQDHNMEMFFPSIVYCSAICYLCSWLPVWIVDNTISDPQPRLILFAHLEPGPRDPAWSRIFLYCRIRSLKPGKYLYLSLPFFTVIFVLQNQFLGFYKCWGTLPPNLSKVIDLMV